MKWMRIGAWLPGGVSAVRNCGRAGLLLRRASTVRQEYVSSLGTGVIRMFETAVVVGRVRAYQ
jgi:hypothetical protein